MVRFFCPRCWADFAEDLERCPKCGLNIPVFLESKDYVDRLVLALEHPERGTPLRAAWILGQLRQPKAVAALIASMQKTKDVYLMKVAIKALGEIGTSEAIDFLKILRSHPARIVRQEAVSILESKGILSQTNPSNENDRTFS